MSIQPPQFLKFLKRENVQYSVSTVVNVYDRGLEELFFIENPSFKRGTVETEESLKKFLEIKRHEVEGIWIYLPWNNMTIYSLPEDLYFKLRTARNKNLITSEEQFQYRQLKVGIAGLSVGQNILNAIVVSGGSKTIKIADFDVIELTNLNRIRAGLADVGVSKAYVAAREVWNVDPFADLYIWDSGLTEDNIKNFIAGEPRLKVFIEEMDRLDLKILSRIVCREERVPVVMATDNGDSVILDVERFDLEPKRPLFHGLVGELDYEGLSKISKEEWLKLAARIIGPNCITPELQRSFLQVGKSLAGVPQLGSTAYIAGAAVSFVLRRIANNYAMPSGRYLISLEEKLIPGYNNEGNVKARIWDINDFEKKLGIRRV